MPAIVLCVVLRGAAFAALVRVRREIQQRRTTPSEWTLLMALDKAVRKRLKATAGTQALEDRAAGR